MTTELASLIDHALLKSDASEIDIRILCQEAKKFGFASVCVNPIWIRFCKQMLNDSKVKVCSVIGFPLGAILTSTKIIEVGHAIRDGADEIDMVINIGVLKSGYITKVEEDICDVVIAANNRIVKVIIETCLLTDKEKVLTCSIVQNAGADFIKTSTGFSNSGATVDDIHLIRQTVGPNFGIKASGGISTKRDALKFIAAGATRIGTSSGVSIINEK